MRYQGAGEIGVKVSSRNILGERKVAPFRSETAYAAMRRHILANDWPPGFQATEQEAADILQMSRTPIREAMMRLQQDGLVSVVPRHGLRVLPVSPDDMREIYEILTSLEATAAGLVAARELGDADLAPLEAATTAMEGALAVDDLNAWAAADAEFHTRLLGLCGNRKLEAIVLNFFDRAHRARMITLKLRPRPTASTQEHVELLQALRRHDAVAAHDLHQAHRQRAGRELVALLRSLGLTQL